MLRMGNYTASNIFQMPLRMGHLFKSDNDLSFGIVRGHVFQFLT